jgi:hypothetical protein
MIGHQVLRHRVGFKGETEARVKFKHVDIGAAQLVGMFLSIRNNGTGRTSLYSSEDYYMTFEHDWVVVRTAGDETPMPSYADADKDCYLHYDGSAKASLANAKQTVATMPAKDVPPGVTAIIVTSDWLCRIESLTLRGVVSLDDSPLLREAWISSELKRIGFAD